MILAPQRVFCDDEPGVEERCVRGGPRDIEHVGGRGARERGAAATASGPVAAALRGLDRGLADADGAAAAVHVSAGAGGTEERAALGGGHVAELSGRPLGVGEEVDCEHDHPAAAVAGLVPLAGPWFPATRRRQGQVLARVTEIQICLDRRSRGIYCSTLQCDLQGTDRRNW